MNLREPITLTRACEAIEIPSGIRNTIPAGSTVRVMQSLGTSYTVATDRGYMFRIDAKDRDALGISPDITVEHQVADHKDTRLAQALHQVDEVC